MANTIFIPIDVHLITLLIESFEIETRTIQVGRGTQTRREQVRKVREVGPGRDASSLTQPLDVVNKIWQPADIVFQFRSIDTPQANAPDNNEEVSPSGFFALANRFPARGAVSALFVHGFVSHDLGGQAAEELGCCILPAFGEVTTAKVLAHELGHLLGLPHVETGKNIHWNLMYKALRADDRLTAEQIKRARTSPLVQRVYQQQSNP